MLLLVAAALAHIQMDDPQPVTLNLKIGPCGAGSHVPGPYPLQLAPGDQLIVRWHETINHPSTFRISFDDDGDDDFVDPAAYDDFYNNPTVLLDDIADEPDSTYEATVTLPTVECDHCTLQLIQVMQDKPPYIPGTDDVYYQCADLALHGTDTGDTAVTAGSGGSGSTTTTGTPGTTTASTTGTTGTGSPPEDSGTPDATDDAETGGGCGCASHPTGVAFAPALFALGWTRRRKSRQAAVHATDGVERAGPSSGIRAIIRL